jgi:hypothetical protein
MKTKIRFFSFVLVLVTLCSLVSCAQRDPNIPDGFLLAENEGADYYFYYPENWLLDRADAGMTSVYVSEVDYSNVSVTAVTAEQEGKTYTGLPEYAEEYYLKQCEGNFRDLKVERNADKSLKRSVLKIDDCEAIAFSYSAVFDGETYRFRAWLISCNGYIYTVLYTAKEDRYEENYDFAEAIATSIQFK